MRSLRLGADDRGADDESRRQRRHAPVAGGRPATLGHRRWHSRRRHRHRSPGQPRRPWDWPGSTDGSGRSRERRRVRSAAEKRGVGNQKSWNRLDRVDPRWHSWPVHRRVARPDRHWARRCASSGGPSARPGVIWIEQIIRDAPAIVAPLAERESATRMIVG